MKKGILLIMLAFACSAAYAQEGSVKDENCKIVVSEPSIDSSGVETVAPAAPVVMPAPFMVRDTTVTEKSGSEEVHTVTALEAKDSKKHNLIILDGNYMFTGGEIYSQKAKVDFMRFKLWPGFTTAFIQASAYHAVPKGMSPEWLFRPTIAFLNGEQRIGGTIGNILGLNLLASYSWTPSLAFMEGALTDMKIDYVSGYDVFFGLTLGDRFTRAPSSIKLF